MYYLLEDVNCCVAEQITHFLAKSLIKKNLLLESITHVKNISKKKPTVKQLLAPINRERVNNWDKSVVEETLCILRTKGIINENYKILMINDTNTLPSDDDLLESPLVSSTDDTHLIQICFCFKNCSFLFLIVQLLLFTLQLYQVHQPRIPKKILFITKMIWRMNELSSWVQNCKLWNFLLKKNYIWWKK